jgi:uncharacterized protein (TIGR02996 family)
MDERAFREAILDDPGDDQLRLVFADWLEENGQADRAEWMRLSLRAAAFEPRQKEYQRLASQGRAHFEKCRPAWLEDVPGVTREVSWGLWWLHARSDRAVKRLGGIGWLTRAAAEGWLAGLAIDWCDGSRAEIVAGWPDAARALPLWVCPAPQISDEGLAYWLSAPSLWLLDLPGRANDRPSIARLGSAHGLRWLRVLVTDETDTPVLEQVKRLTALRKLSIHGGTRPTDDDLAALSGLSGLRELSITFSRTLTNAGLLRLAALCGLRRLILRDCFRVTAAGIAALKKAMPSLTVKS